MFQLGSLPLIGNVVKALRRRGPSDSADYFSYSVTALLLLVFALIISAKQYIGSPIQCWMPPQFKTSWEQYAEDYCFIENTYFYPMTEKLPHDEALRMAHPIVYYQWVPLALVLQAILFHLPSLLWSWIVNQAAVDFEHVLKEATEIRALAGDKYEERLGTLVEYLCDRLELLRVRRSQRRIFGVYCKGGSWVIGAFVSFAYLGVKLLYLANVVLQFWLLRKFLSPRYFRWCWAVVSDWWFSQVCTAGDLFPKVVMCDFAVRDMAPTPTISYSIQCVLMVNKWNEVVYLVFGLWLVMMAVIVLGSCITYACAMLSCTRRKSIGQLLHVYCDDHLDEESMSGGWRCKDVDTFSDSLACDGYLLLRFVESTGGGDMARRICEELYLKYQES